ncbi:MAG: hypothetical protein M3217_06340 [Actinomycetota bacterium]|nr:hypothetical protein [Actinomycetota bacterium]
MARADDGAAARLGRSILEAVREAERGGEEAGRSTDEAPRAGHHDEHPWLLDLVEDDRAEDPENPPT